MFSAFRSLRNNHRTINRSVYWPIAKPLYAALGTLKRYLLSPCFTNMLGWYNGEIVDNKLKDITPGRGDHAATKAVSLKFSGAQYGALAEAVTLVGDFKISLECKDLHTTQSQMLLSADTSDYVRYNTGYWVVKIAAVSYMFTNVTEQGSVNIARVVDQLTVTTATQSQTLTVNTGNTRIKRVGDYSGTHFTIGNLWDIYAEDSTGVKFHNYLAQKSDTGTVESVVGPAVSLTGFILPDDFTETSQYGHSWNKESYYSGASGKIPEDPDNLGYAVTGEALNRIGTARQDMAVTGYTGDWDGAAYGILDSQVTLSGDFKFEYLHPAITTGINHPVVGQSAFDGLISTNTSDRIEVNINGSWYSAPTLTIAAGEIISVTRVGTTLTFSVGSVTEEVTGVTSADFIFSWIARASTQRLTDPLVYIKVYNQSDTLIHHWICQSSKTSNQDKIYDIIGGNHATLTGATLPFFTQEMTGSIFGVGGSTGNTGIEDHIVPADPNSPGYDIFGNPLTFKTIIDAPANVALVSAPETAEYWAADGTHNKWLTTGGVAIPRDPATIDSNYNNQYFAGWTEVNNKEFINYNEPIIGYCLLETKKYLNNIQYIIDDASNQVQDDAGNDIVI